MLYVWDSPRLVSDYYKEVSRPRFFMAESVRTPLVESPTYLICQKSPNIDGDMVGRRLDFVPILSFFITFDLERVQSHLWRSRSMRQLGPRTSPESSSPGDSENGAGGPNWH